MSAVHELAEARRQERSAYNFMQSLTARIALTQQAIRQPGPLEHDERKQLAYQLRSMGIARDRARDDWQRWTRIVRLLAPTPRRGSISLAL